MNLLKSCLSAIWRSSIVWGVLAAIGFFSLIHNDVLPQSELLRRYTTGEWVECIETAFFFIGIAELLLKALDIVEQRQRWRHASLLDPVLHPMPAADAKLLLDRLAAMPRRDQNGYFPRRIREALQIVGRKGSADSLEDELKYLADADTARAHNGFAFMRIVIWSIPIWGFLGTVIGITDAIASLDPAAMESSLGHVTASLGGVFDTTALALVLSIALMFCQFFVDRQEGRLLAEVDAKSAQELTDRFETNGTRHDPQLATFDRMASAMLETAEKVVDRRIETALGASLVRSVQAHARQLAEAEAAAAEQNRQHWDRIHEGFVECSQQIQSQSEILLKVVHATAEVSTLENTLNGNLSALAGSQQFQETQLNLLAAVHLLTARLGQLTPLRPQVVLDDHSREAAA